MTPLSGTQLALILTSTALLAATPAGAQQVRVRATTTARYVELLPLRLDSTGDFVAGERQGAAPVTQDFELSAWGLGLPGLRAYGLVRLRGALGSELVWPRYDDTFDALHAFVELDRPRWRARAGRQQRVSGLGFYAFDGASGLWRPRANIRVEAFVGRGLARGFLEPLSSDAIRSLEPTRPEQGTLLFGAGAWTSPARGWTVGATWQREILSDWSGLVSERAALDAQGLLGRRFSFAASMDGDLAAGAVGRARLAVAWRRSAALVEVEAFRYRPVFDLTTIWGVFSPEGHHGYGARAEVPVGRGIVATGSLSYRLYRPVTETTPFLVGVGDNSAVLSLGGRWSGRTLSLDARYRLLTGYGGAQSGGDVQLGWAQPEAQWTAGLRAVAFQEEQQFRVADGTVFGLGGRFAIRVSDLLSTRAELAQYWHHPSEGDLTLDWSQLRALIAVELAFGASADRVRGYR